MKIYAQERNESCRQLAIYSLNHFEIALGYLLVFRPLLESERDAYITDKEECIRDRRESEKVLYTFIYISTLMLNY